MLNAYLPVLRRPLSKKILNWQSATYTYLELLQWLLSWDYFNFSACVFRRLSCAFLFSVCPDYCCTSIYNCSVVTANFLVVLEATRHSDECSAHRAQVDDQGHCVSPGRNEHWRAEVIGPARPGPALLFCLLRVLSRPPRKFPSRSCVYK